MNTFMAVAAQQLAESMSVALPAIKLQYLRFQTHVQSHRGELQLPPLGYSQYLDNSSTNWLLRQ